MKRNGRKNSRGQLFHCGTCFPNGVGGFHIVHVFERFVYVQMIDFPSGTFEVWVIIHNGLIFGEVACVQYGSTVIVFVCGREVERFVNRVVGGRWLPVAFFTYFRTKT